MVILAGPGSELDINFGYELSEHPHRGTHRVVRQTHCLWMQNDVIVQLL